MAAVRAFCAPQEAPRPGAHLGARGQACNSNAATSGRFYLRLVSEQQSEPGVTMEPRQEQGRSSLAANNSSLTIYCDDASYDGRCYCGRCHPFGTGGGQ